MKRPPCGPNVSHALCSLLHCGGFYMSSPYLKVHQMSADLSEEPLTGIYGQNSEDDFIPGRTGSKKSCPGCLLPIVTCATFCFSAPGCLVYLYKRCLFFERWLDCNFGCPSVSMSVCWSLWEERGCGCRPLAQTGLSSLGFSSGWGSNTGATCVTSDVAKGEQLCAPASL